MVLLGSLLRRGSVLQRYRHIGGGSDNRRGYCRMKRVWRQDLQPKPLGRIRVERLRWLAGPSSKSWHGHVLMPVFSSLTTHGHGYMPMPPAPNVQIDLSEPHVSGG